MKVLTIILLTIAALSSHSQAQPVIWEQTNWPGNGEWVQCLDATDNTIAIGTADNGVFLSTNGGILFLPTPIVATSVTSIAIDDHFIFAATSNGLQRLDMTDNTVVTLLNKAKVMVVRNSVIYVDGTTHSTDNGVSWQPETIKAAVTSMAPTDSTVVAGTGAGVWKIDEMGRWEQSGLKALNISSIAASDSTIFAGASKDGGLFRSTNNGATWMRSDNGFKRSWTVRVIVAHNAAVLVSTDSGFYRSTDNGNSWQELSATAGPLPLFYDGFYLYGGYRYSALDRSSDFGTTWTRLNKGLAKARINSISSNSTTVYVAYDEGVVSTTDKGNSWSFLKGGNIKCVAVFEDLVLTDGNCIVKHNNAFYAGLEGGVFRSADNGSSWRVKSKGLGALPDALCLLSVGNTLYTGLIDYTGSFGGLYKSTDDGDSWDSIAFGNKTVSDLAAIGKYLFFASPDSGAYRSSNGGMTWTYRGMGEHYVTDFAVDGSVLYASTAEAGVFYSKDLGDHWIEIDSGLGTLHVQTLHLSGNTLYAGTIDRALYKTDITTISRSVPSDKTTRQEIMVYPNPANDKFHSSLRDENPIGVEYRLFDELGIMIISGTLVASDFTVNVESIPSGIYNLQIKSARGIMSSKVLIVH